MQASYSSMTVVVISGEGFEWLIYERLHYLHSTMADVVIDSGKLTTGCVDSWFTYLNR